MMREAETKFKHDCGQTVYDEYWPKVKVCVLRIPGQGVSIGRLGAHNPNPCGAQQAIGQQIGADGDRCVGQ